jgi:hypothetical protein
MNQSTSDAIPASVHSSPAAFKRSPVLAQFRTNCLRVLRLPPNVSVDQAIWQAEAALTRLRAGLPSPEPDLLPWMPEPDEPEIRQAVQRIEEPLQRLADELFWFDLERDPDGDLLRRALAELDPVLLNEYLDLGEADPVAPGPRSPIAFIKPDGVIAVSPSAGAVPATNGEPSPDGSDPLDIDIGVSAAGVPRLLNQANLRLLLAALSLYDSLADDVAATGALEDAGQASTLQWSPWHGLESCRDPHRLRLTEGRPESANHRTVALWTDSLARWLRLTQVPAFVEFVNQSIARLDDEVIGPDDAETVVTTATTRLMDLLVGELKAQFLAGRVGRVGALVEVAQASDVDPRRWGMAFRQLRPLIRTEVADLDPLLPDAEDRRFDDAALYLARLRTILTRWQSCDRSGLLGLGEIGDEAVSKVCDWLLHMESYAAVDRLKRLYADAMGLATAESLKQRIATTVTRLNGLEQWACHFCRQRDMELQRSVVIKGKRESHRTHGFNSTTIHYVIETNIIPRCARCSELHEYVWDVGKTVRAAFGVVIAGCVGILLWTQPLGANVEPGVYLILGAIAILLVWAPGILARRSAAFLVTPRGERKYWKANTAKPYREMRLKGCKMTIDYRKSALDLLGRQQGS